MLFFSLLPYPTYDEDETIKVDSRTGSPIKVTGVVLDQETHNPKSITIYKRKNSIDYYTYSSGNYEDFKKLFGSRSSERGALVNKPLLGFWKHRFKLDEINERNPFALGTRIRNLDQLYDLVINDLNGHFENSNIELMIGDSRYMFYSDKYCTTSSRGISSSFDPKYIEYRNIKSGKIYKMGAGKFFREIIRASKARLDEATITYCSEEFQRRWEADIADKYSNIELHVDKNFKDIYDSNKQEGNFGSCMNNKNQYVFYEKCVDASAAYLTKGDKILARCILYHNVKDDMGNLHEYAERQYSGNETYKYLLISKLLAEKKIDCYKTIGAGCRETTAILDANGNRIANYQFKIKCNIEEGDVLSFLDSFAYYSPSEKEACNMDVYTDTKRLDHTTAHF